PAALRPLRHRVHRARVPAVHRAPAAGDLRLRRHAGRDQRARPGEAPPLMDRRHVLLRWGLPRDPRASEHVLGFVLTTVATIVVTRGYLQLTGFPQIGGETPHAAHVLSGGLFMAVAMGLLLSLAGPVVRPPAAFLGGSGSGRCMDEVGMC